MFWNYFHTAVRLIKKYKLHSSINIIGLSIGLSLCLIMLMFVANEFSYDNFYPNRDRIYRVTAEWGSEGSKMNFAGVMPAISPALNSDVPEVEYAARVKRNNELTILAGGNDEYREEDFFYADPEVLKVFTLKLMEGDVNTALSEPYSIVLTKSVANKYFGNSDPLGRVITIEDKPYKVTGLLADVPENTHLHYRAFISYMTLISEGAYPQYPWTSWGEDLTYVLFQKNASVKACSDKLREIFVGQVGQSFSDKMILSFQPLSAIHWDNTLRSDIGPKGSLLYTYLFLSAAILVMAIACLNFMNLSTVKYIERTKEVCIRKVIGANRIELGKQFLVESLLTIFIAVVIGIVLYESLGSVLYAYMNVQFFVHSAQLLKFYLITVAVLMMAGLIAGYYPAFLFSRRDPVETLKGKSAPGHRKFALRKLPVILQFVISAILICCTLTIFRQIDYMKNTNLGFDKEDVVFAYLPYDQPNVAAKYDVLRNELLRNPNVTQVSAGYTLPGVNSQFQMGVKKKDSAENDYITIQVMPVDYDFIKLMRINLTEGRDFSREFPTDAKEGIILNETAVAALNFKDAVGQTLMVPRGNEFQPMKVIGVAADFHVKSLHSKIAPAMMMIYPDYYSLVAVRFNPDTQGDVIRDFRSKWQSVFPDNGFNYRFMADEYNRLYDTEEKAGKLISIFTILALFISCLGLFGLISFVVSKKIKEIGIRRVLGASIQEVALLLSKEFIQWVLIANLIAWPVAWLIINKWLQNFAYRVHISAWVFLLAGVLTVLIAWATVNLRAIRAARANPIESLRYE